jgi:hypothetical protein
MFDFLTHINLPPYLLFIVIVLGILTYYFHKDISKLITRKWSKENDIKDLKSHDIFNTLQRVKQDVSHMKFYTNGVFDANKSRMCSDFAKFKCNVCSDSFVEFLDNDFSKISSDELKQLVLSEMWGMHSEYIKQIRAFWLEKGINNEDVDYVIELFEKFRYDVVVSFQNRINGIFSSSYHKNNFEKILACYEMYSMGIDLLPKDMLTTFEALNGRFANIKYK